MSDDNKRSDNSSDFLDNFDFDAFNADESQESTPESSFDLDNPFGDDLAPPSREEGKEEITGELPESTEESFVGFGDSFGDDSSTSDSGVSADNPYLSDPTDAESPDGETKGKKKGFFGGLFGGKGKKAKTKQEKSKKASSGEESGVEESDAGDLTGESEEAASDKKKNKKEKRENKPAGERAPLGVGEILCIVFSVFLLASLLVFNIATFLFSEPGQLIQTLVFMGAFNIIGLAAASVPILFYKFPKERTLPNVMLGISAVALFIGVQVTIIEFHRYGFTMGGA
jgi:uncharacterized membrane protein